MLRFTLMGTNQRVHHAKSNLRPTSRKDEVGLGGVIFQFVTQGCLGKRKVNRKSRAFHLQETTKHHHHHQRLSHSKAASVTLAEWIVNSPGWNNGNFEGNPLLQKPTSKPRRVHPSVLNKMNEEVVKCGGRIDHEDAPSFSSMTRSGTFKKRVSFKEPEVADVFILKDSPEN